MMWKDTVQQFLQASSNLSCMVVGDLMLDQYLKGTSERRSPEADVPILALQERAKHPGGAANVALNLVDFCKHICLAGVVGDDQGGTSLLDILVKKGVDTSGIYCSTERPTTVKTRLMSGSKQLMRVDNEVTRGLSQLEKDQTLSLIKENLTRVRPDIVILQDYNKGLLTDDVISQVLDLCASGSIPVAVDPKFENIQDYQGVALFKPNFKELQAMVPMSIDRSVADLDLAAAHLRNLIGFERLMVTLSDAGIYYCEEANGHIVPTDTVEVVDVCGAGDAVIAMAALGLAGGLGLADIVKICNQAGGIVCGLPGVQPMTKSLLNA